MLDKIMQIGRLDDPSSLTIGYSSGYEFQNEYTKVFQTTITGYRVDFDWYQLWPNGLLVVKKGYAWDGMTGWFDTKSNRIYSMVHDVFCQMMRNNQIPHIYKEVNEYCADLGRACGMWWVSVQIVTAAVNLRRSGDPGRGPDRPVLYSPPQ